MTSDFPPVGEPDERPRPRAWSAAAAIALLALLPAVGGAAYLAGRSGSLVPPASSSVVVERPAPNVLLAVRDLARLESADYHMERVVDLRDKQSSLWGLVHAEDALLLVAVGNVTAGIDLGRMQEGDIDADWEGRTVTIVLPAAEVFSAKLDNEHTYVASRSTDLLAQRKEGLEGRARAAAETELAQAARAANILEKANANARRTVEGLVRSLGYDTITVRTRGG